MWSLPSVAMTTRRATRCKRRLKSAAGGARKVRHLPAEGNGFWPSRSSLGSSPRGRTSRRASCEPQLAPSFIPAIKILTVADLHRVRALYERLGSSPRSSSPMRSKNPRSEAAESFPSAHRSANTNVSVRWQSFTIGSQSPPPPGQKHVVDAFCSASRRASHQSGGVDSALSRSKSGMVVVFHFVGFWSSPCRAADVGQIRLISL